MVFGLFSRKSLSGPLVIEEDTPTPEHSNPEPVGIAALEQIPPGTPTPPPPQSLHELITSIPPKLLHSYTLNNLRPDAEPSPSTLAALSTFFSRLEPPPLLHCVRCHKDFFEIENNDLACVLAHDDDSADVQKIGRGADALLETLFECCGKTVEGDGDLGPPDGWCYEGMHTTDTKRARFRADSTPTNDKLISCDVLNCHGDQSISSSTRGRSTRRRIRPSYLNNDGEDAITESDDNEVSGVDESDSGVDEIMGRPKRRKTRASSARARSVARAGSMRAASVNPRGRATSVNARAGSVKPPNNKGKGKATDNDGDVNMEEGHQSSPAPPPPTTKPKSKAPAKPRAKRVTKPKVVESGADMEAGGGSASVAAPKTKPSPNPRAKRAPKKSKAIIDDSDAEPDASTPAPPQTPAARAATPKPQPGTPKQQPTGTPKRATSVKPKGKVATLVAGFETGDESTQKSTPIPSRPKSVAGSMKPKSRARTAAAVEDAEKEGEEAALDPRVPAAKRRKVEARCAD